MFERQYWRFIDWWMIGGLFIVSGFGLSIVYSASYSNRSSSFFETQLLWVFIGFVVLAAIMWLDYHIIADRAELLYVLFLGVLLYLLLFGDLRAATNRWLELGGVRTLQPGEFTKLAVVIFLSKYFSSVRQDKLRTSEILATSIFVAPPVILIALQPDLGTAVTIVFIYLVMVLLAGISRKQLLCAGLLVSLALPLSFNFLLKDYQKERIYSFLDPGRDPQGTGYQSIQSTIAVGAGGFKGKGWLAGTQSQLQFLPTPHTDFVFAVIAEEFGFLGVTIVLLLYLLITLRGIDTARRSRDRLGMFLVTGVLSMFIFQTAYNISMVAGLVPIKGFPLPLISYGGSSLLSTMMGFGLILSVRLRRFAN